MTEFLEQPFVEVPLRALVAFVVVLLAQLPVIYALLKIHSRIMSRMGPMYAGRFHGIGQPLAEAIKWIQKEDIIPGPADRKIFVLAPIIAVVPTIMIFAVLPIAPGWVAADLELGLLYALAMAAISVIGVVGAAYSARSKFTLIGGVRGVAQLTAYELPIVVGALSVAMLAGSLNLSAIVEAQTIPYLFWPLPFGAIAFVVFFVGAMAEVMWAPFDMPVAESEIITGPFTEYSGMRYIFSHMFAEMGHLVAFGGIAATLFLGGYRPIVPWGPLEYIPGIVWFFAKTAFMIFVFLWIRPTFPRVREHQLQKFAWKFLIPVALLLILLTGAWIKYDT
jgi:NADH-quinone oxidoreductase subunit H